MYSQIYDILLEALYGSEAVLDTYQSFVLTQLSTYLAYGVVLIPVIAVVALTIKLLKW